MCIYDKLTKSSKFKDLFIDTFGEDENLNVKFTVSDTLSVNGRCITNELKVHPITKEIVSAKMEIVINKSLFTNSSSISVARTILHECIHAYLIVK